MSSRILATLSGFALLAGTSAQAAGFDVIDTETYEPTYIEDYTRGTLSYVHIEDDTFDDDWAWFGDIEGERQYGNALFLGGLTFYKDEFGTDWQVEAGVGYYVTPEILLGVKLDHYDYGPEETDVTIFGQYEGARGSVGLSFTDVDNGDDRTVLSGEYMISSTANIGGIWVNEDDYNNLTLVFDNSYGNTGYTALLSVDDDDFVGAALYVEHQYNDRIKAFAGLGLSDDNGFSANFVGAGAGYKVADNVWIEAAAAHYNTDSSDGNIYSIALIYELGKSKRIERRIENKIRDVYEGVGVFFEF